MVKKHELQLPSSKLQLPSSEPHRRDGGIQTAIDTTPTGQTLTPDAVWTGTDTNGSNFSFAELGDPNPRVGVIGSTNGTWISNSTTFTSTEEFKFYAMSDVLEVPEPAQSTPEPSGLLDFITLGGFMLGSAVRRAKK